jgi:hypothetical protein
MEYGILLYICVKLSACEGSLEMSRYLIFLGICEVIKSYKFMVLRCLFWFLFTYSFSLS